MRCGLWPWVKSKKLNTYTIMIFLDSVIPRGTLSAICRQETWNTFYKRFSFNFIMSTTNWDFMKRNQFYQNQSIWWGVQFVQHYNLFSEWKLNKILNILARQEPLTRCLQEHVQNLFILHSWLTYGWKTVRFNGYFILFLRIKRQSCLRADSKHQHKLIWRAFHTCSS